MDTEENVNKAWNEGFEAGISFAKAELEAKQNDSETLKHDFGCLIYMGCKCKDQSK